MDTKKTERGFAIGEFEDLYGEKCSIQKSSLASQNAIWLGVEVKPKILASHARKMGLDTNGQNSGWIDYHFPKEVLLSGRMHLSQSQVAELLPILQKFVYTGEID